MSSINISGNYPSGIITINGQDVLLSWHVDGSGNGSCVVGSTTVNFNGVTFGTNNDQAPHGKLPATIVSSLANTRDIKEYISTDGKEIKPNKLIRSGKLENLTATEASALVSYGLNRIVDFRTDGEILQDPDFDFVGAGHSVNSTQIDLIGAATIGITFEFPDPSNGDADGDGVVSELELVYYAVQFFKHIHQLAVANGDATGLEGAVEYGMGLSFPAFVDGSQPNPLNGFKQFFEILIANTTGCTLFHCTAGKDRVGTATALLMMALGIDRETIVNDFLYTNDNYAADIAAIKVYLTYLKIYNEVIFTNGPNGPVASLVPVTPVTPGAIYDAVKGKYYKTMSTADIDDAAVLQGVSEQWVRSMFDAIDEEYGSFYAFWTDALGLTAADLDALRSIYMQ